MKSNSKLFIAVGIILVLGIAVVGLVAMNRNNDAAKNTTGAPASNQAATSNTDTVQSDSVTIQNYAFSPAIVTVKAGTTVTWTNQDSVKHTVTGVDTAASGLDSALLGKGEVFDHTFAKAGTYSYYCQPHPYMKGTVVVTD